LFAYSIAAAGSWIEHGPTTTNSRSSSPIRIRVVTSRASLTTRAAVALVGRSAISTAGAIKGRI